MKVRALLREDDERHALLEYLASVVVGLSYLACSATVDEYMMCVLAGHTEEGHPSKRFLHHPLEVAVQETVDEEDVEGPLMVADEDVALLGVEVLASFHMYGQQKEVTD